jgi:methylenetetrahydrofolate reductase (NADPH)
MTVIEKIEQARDTLFTFEIMPPLKGCNFDEIAATIERLLPYKPAYINITNHRAEQIAVEQPDGSIENRILKKRAGTAAIAAAIRYRYGIEVVPHLVCAGYSRSDVEDMLLDFAFLGICNVLALRGDAMRGSPRFEPHPQGDSRAIDVLRQIMRLNDGIFIDESIRNAQPPVQFCAGVAGYPELHAEASSRQADLRCLKEKVEAGASYVVTQMFFDNEQYFRFVDECRRIGIGVPIIPGLKPLASKKQLETLPQIFHLAIPKALYNKVNACHTPQDVRSAGEEWCIAQCEELMAMGVPALHFYTMSKADNVENVVRSVFGRAGSCADKSAR